MLENVSQQSCVKTCIRCERLKPYTIHIIQVDNNRSDLMPDKSYFRIETNHRLRYDQCEAFGGF